MNKIKTRLFVIAILFSLGFVIVAVRTYIIGISKGQGIYSQANNILRGAIRDRNGFTLALTEEASTISLAPQEIYDIEQTSELLEPYLDMSSTDILQKIYERKNQLYFYLKRQVDNLKADQIIDLSLPGVYREREYKRRYPGKTLASNILGFVGRDQNKALSGLERHFNDILLYTTTKDPHRGTSLQLSIDSLLQYHLELELGQTYAASGSKRAAGILMDIQSGAILAMASFPNFDPNEYYKSTPFERGNWAVRLNYEPGSTVKVIMAATLLAEKTVRLKQRFLCEGELYFHDSHIRCRQRGSIIKHGSLTLSEIIEKSCNVGIIKAMRKIKAKHLYAYMKGLGFGEQTGILPSGSGETKGYFPVIDNWVASTLYYMPIGQGFSMTPIQLLRANASIVNGGRLLRPFLAWRIRSPENNSILNERQPQWTKSPFPAKVRQQIKKMMQRVVSRGTGRKAKITKLGVMGKTGTGEKSSAQGYLDKYIVSFMGFFPTKKPRYGVLILYDEPQANHSGGSLAAPSFRRFVVSILPFLESRSHSVTLEKLRPQPVRSLNIKKDRLYDLRGLAARDAVQIVSGFYKLKVKLKGNGYVYQQIPRPGTPIKKIKTVILNLRSL